jgi:hypothetical protein
MIQHFQVSVRFICTLVISYEALILQTSPCPRMILDRYSDTPIRDRYFDSLCSKISDSVLSTYRCIDSFQCVDTSISRKTESLILGRRDYNKMSQYFDHHSIIVFIAWHFYFIYTCPRIRIAVSVLPYRCFVDYMSLVKQQIQFNY